MSSYGRVSHTSEETVEHTVDCDDSGKSESQSCSSWGFGGCADMGLWVAVIVLIILWTLAVWAGWSWFSSSNSKRGKGKGCDDNDGFGGGCIGAGLLWLIILVIFVAAAFRCGWGAVVGFLVFFLIILLIGWWFWSSC